MLTNRNQMAKHVQALNGDQVKDLVIGWLLETEGQINDFTELLEANIEENRLQMEDDGVYGDLDEDLDFQPLTEEEMVAKSLDVLAEYKRTGIGIPHERVQEWLDSLGTENPLPCPR
jgi:hypothetical protein